MNSFYYEFLYMLVGGKFWNNDKFKICLFFIWKVRGNWVILMGFFLKKEKNVNVLFILKVNICYFKLVVNEFYKFILCYSLF